MRQFLKFFFASMFGTIFALLIVFFLILGMLAAASAGFTQAQERVKAKPNSVLHLKLNYPIPERTPKNPLTQLSFSFDPPRLGLNDILKNIRDAKTDDNIKGIYLEVTPTPSAFATLEAIRNALMDFKSSGKFIVAYGEILSQKGYYVASVADKIYANPSGFVEFRGLSSQLVFLKGTLDRLGIEPQIFYAGKFKSATEPLRLEKMSDENREQITSVIVDIYTHFIKNIAEARNLNSELLDSIADNMLIVKVEDAVHYSLIDGLAYFDEVIKELKERSGLTEDDKLPLMSIQKYRKSTLRQKEGGDEIAVLYAQGAIIDGQGDEDEIGSERFAKAIRDIRENKKIKALVMRINSGGGSVLASEVILREVMLAREKMPVIVSMGDVAASGGYYIACMADTILAQPNTITGSIGVFGLLPNMQKFFNDKLGMTFDGVKTGKFSDMGTVSRPMTEEERAIWQKEIDRIYLEFKERVASGRGMSADKVESIAQGRIWTGLQAKDNGLVDLIGGLDEAISIAAEKAQLTDYELKDYPKQKDPFEKLMEELSGTTQSLLRSTRWAPYYSALEKLTEIEKLCGIQARLPYELEIN
ncbi:MAG: signal peptide peptidase SppA [Chitinophagales bacterium]|nr:MAG: signal peptide peptidase SppA [Chitinophagales bacterium]